MQKKTETSFEFLARASTEFGGLRRKDGTNKREKEREKKKEKKEKEKKEKTVTFFQKVAFWEDRECFHFGRSQRFFLW